MLESSCGITQGVESNRNQETKRGGAVGVGQIVRVEGMIETDKDKRERDTAQVDNWACQKERQQLEPWKSSNVFEV